MNLVKELETLRNDLLAEFPNIPETIESIEKLNLRITNGLYDVCARNQKKTNDTNIIPFSENTRNCSSKNFKAIADANEANYRRLLNQGDPRSSI